MADYEPPDELVNKLNPIEIISQYWTDNFINLLCSQSKIYAQQHALQSEKVTPDNMKVFLAILALSGYSRVPYRRLYWAESEDTWNSLVANAMRRDYEIYIRPDTPMFSLC